jgi:hypothetical protein
MPATQGQRWTPKFMPEYRSYFDLPPSVLMKEDIVALAKLLEAGIPLNSHSVEYTANTGEASYQAKSINDLLTQLPGNADQLDFRVFGWTDDNSIDRGFLITPHAKVPRCQIHSIDEIWYRGKLSQIHQFFRARRPWYGGALPYIRSISDALQPALLFSAVYLWLKGNHVLSVFATLTLVALVMATTSFITGQLLAHTRIVLVQRTSWLTKDLAMVIFTALGATATLVGVII